MSSSSSSNTFLLLIAAWEEDQMKKKKLNNRKRRSIWTKKWLERRCGETGDGGLKLLHNELRLEDKDAFRNYIRMDEECFQILLNKIEHRISYKNTKFRQCINARDRLTITLRYLATGETFQSLSYSFRVGRSTICGIVPEVLKAICDVLHHEYIKVPGSENEWCEIEKIFREIWNFPNCCGAIDGKHINFLPPRSDGSYYRNYKGTDSIVLLAMVDGNYRFLLADVGTNGRASDGGVFKNSPMSTLINENILNIPKNVQLPESNESTPFIFVADDAFPLTTRIMKPFRYHGLSKEQKIYNYRVSRARRVVENTFGILANRFRILLHQINLNVVKVELITSTCCILHNFLIHHRGQHYVGNEDDVNCDLSKVNKTLNPGNRSTQSAMSLRNVFMNYFNTAGQVPWQERYIVENKQ